MVFEREYSIGRLDREVGGQRESRLGSQEEVETAWNLIEWDVETRLPGFASFPSVRTGREGREGGGDLSGRDGEVEKDYSSRILLVMILRGNERGDTVTGYPVTLHYPRQRDGTLVLEKVCRVHRLLRPHDSLHE